MPVLDIVMQQVAEAQKKQLSLISLEANRALTAPMQHAMESYAKEFNYMEKIADTLTQPMREIGKTLEKISLEPYEGILQIVMDSQKRMLEDPMLLRVIKDAQNMAIPQHVIDVIEADVLAKETKTAGMTEMVTTNQPIIDTSSLILPTPKQRNRMGLKQIAGGNFSYKRRTLQGISLGNQEGRLLELLLKDENFLAADEIIQEKFFVTDVVLEVSHVVMRLRKKFRQNGLAVTITRQGYPAGYILIKIEYLQ